MKYLKLFEEYNKKSRKIENLNKRKIELESKFEILLDSIVEVMDDYGFKYYEEEDDWSPPDEPYYEYSYNWDGTLRQINIVNISMCDCEPEELVYALEQIKPKLELRTGFKISIDYYHGEGDDFIKIDPNLPKR